MLKTEQSFGCWTVAEDMQLLKLYEDLGPKWSKIAGILKKNRVYVRHRYATIGRHLAKGRELTSIPRKRADGRADCRATAQEEAFVLDHMRGAKEDIDTRLRRYFERNRTPVAAPGRKKKYYDKDELTNTTKGLYNIFQQLDVQLEVPEDLEITGLTSLDKQLLVSFKSYAAGKGQSIKHDLESVRKKMFGEDKKEGVTEFFIPPAPFGLCFKTSVKKGGKKPAKKGVKTPVPGTTDKANCNAMIDYNMQFPENVEKMMNDAEVETFDKLIDLVARPCRGPVQEETVMMECDEEEDLITNSGITAVSWGRKVGERRIEDDERDKRKIMEPSWATLWGYENLRHMKEVNGELDWTKAEKEMSKQPVSAAGKAAFHAFKTRFMRLFKYPLGMSKYAEVHDGGQSSTAMTIDDDEVDDGNED